MRRDRDAGGLAILDAHRPVRPLGHNLQHRRCGRGEFHANQHGSRSRASGGATIAAMRRACAVLDNEPRLVEPVIDGRRGAMLGYVPFHRPIKKSGSRPGPTLKTSPHHRCEAMRSTAPRYRGAGGGNQAISDAFSRPGGRRPARAREERPARTGVTAASPLQDLIRFASVFKQSEDGSSSAYESTRTTTTRRDALIRSGGLHAARIIRERPARFGGVDAAAAIPPGFDSLAKCSFSNPSATGKYAGEGREYAPPFCEPVSGKLRLRNPFDSIERAKHQHPARENVLDDPRTDRGRRGHVCPPLHFDAASTKFSSYGAKSPISLRTCAAFAWSRWRRVVRAATRIRPAPPKRT